MIHKVKRASSAPSLIQFTYNGGPDVLRETDNRTNDFSNSALDGVILDGATLTGLFLLY